MTDKEIIIDGVNVSKCEYRDWRNFCHCDNSKENEGEKRVTGRGGCKYNPDCHYKQLKRKEQECEELKEQHKKVEDMMIKSGANMCGELQNLYRALDEIIRFFKDDKKFARYSGFPLVFTNIALEKIEEILKENDIKIGEVKNV